ncbi:MAG: 5-formyltetrahydrofolate cyclo-ligase [Campylobacter sp.]|nr:5-formyltetrahydrofolate cyclo-ligase [Campylobacter sp.]
MEKQEFRKKSLSNLKFRSQISAKASHYALLSNLIKLIDFTNSKRILLYMPLFYEPDVYRLRKDLARKCEIFIPFMVGLSLEMVRLKLPFYVSKFKLRTPLGSKRFKKRIDMAVVPCVGVDGAMKRIGHGVGYYDRFFASLPYKPLIVFVQKNENFTSQILSEEHDISCDYYLTPNKFYVKRGIDDRNFSRLRCRCCGDWGRLPLRQKDKRRQLQHIS